MQCQGVRTKVGCRNEQSLPGKLAYLSGETFINYKGYTSTLAQVSCGCGVTFVNWTWGASSYLASFTDSLFPFVLFCLSCSRLLPLVALPLND